MSRINIAGAGLSGLSAAITLARAGVETNLISPQSSERAQSVLAEGGINGALDLMGENDTPEEHFLDTMRGGCDLADPNAVWAMTQAAPEVLKWLCGLGVPFNRENGRMIQRNFGGQRKKRTAFAKSSTGKILMTALIDEARRHEAAGRIHRYPHHEAVELALEDGRCTGIWIRDCFSGTVLLCPGPVILCTGGMNGMFPGMTTGTTANTGDVTALAFSQGVELGNLEFIQYHPTTAQIPGKRLLVSEAARGEGGRLFVEKNGQPWYFMEELYPELGNLMPRDVISREMTALRDREDCGNQVYLDLRGLQQETWERKLPDLREEILQYLHLDPAKEPVPVSPGIHFFMGGILVNEAHETNIPGLLAAGECACQYHGANRLGGNSMLGAIYGGQRAAQSALALPLTGGVPVPAEKQLPEMECAGDAGRLSQVLLEGLGVFRDGPGLEQALRAASGLLESAQSEQARRRVRLGCAMLQSAMARQESRGAHVRLDYPDRNDKAYRKTTVTFWRDGEIHVSFRSIPERSVVS